MEILLTIIYTTIFILLIYKMKFFIIEGLSRRTISAIFALKIIVGVILWMIYTYYYTDRKSADIFKYFDDGEIIYNTLFVNPVHYLQLVLGIDTDANTSNSI
ncbi:MAG: hypothetical protein ABII90_16025 [Bacteroidota bacterium]